MVKWSIGITGGSGFIGSSLTEHFKRFSNVRVLDVKPPSHGLKEGVEFRSCDIRNFSEVKHELETMDLVIHTAIVQIPLINEARRLGYETNILGTQNICEAVNESPSVKGMILAGSWHTIGERELKGVITEEFGFRPDKVEDRARLYVLTKIAQESIVRFYSEMSSKIYGVIRMGTVLGDGMPEKTVANMFIDNGLKGKPLTPYKHSMYRPMLYVDLNDICKAFEAFATGILDGKIKKESDSLAHVINVFYPTPTTVLEMAEIVKNSIIKNTNNKIKPKIEIVDTGHPSLFTKIDKTLFKVDVNKALNFLGLKLTSPKKSIETIVKTRLSKSLSS